MAMMTLVEYGFMPYFLMEAVWHVTVVVIVYLSWRMVRAYERRGLERGEVSALMKRVDSLEATLEQVDVQLSEAAESQRFTTAVLLARSGLPHGSDGRAADS